MSSPTRDYTGLTFVGGSVEEIQTEYVRIRTVDMFIDSLLITLTHYSAVGRLHAKGLASDDVLYFSFPSALGDGYLRDDVETLRAAAYHAIESYERGDSHTAHLCMSDVADAITALKHPRRTRMELLQDA